jgi:hypothetical protein
MKSLGRKKIFVVIPKLNGEEKVHVLSDLWGLTVIYYENIVIDEPHEWDARLEPVCSLITEQIEKMTSLDHRQRGAAINGGWRGEIVQSYGPDGLPKTFLADAEFEFNLEMVRGHLTMRGYITDDRNELKVKLSGRFVYESYLKLDYKYTDNPGSINFGTVVLKLNDLGDRCDGRYLGYGAYSTQLVSGAVMLKKIRQA